MTSSGQPPAAPDAAAPRWAQPVFSRIREAGIRRSSGRHAEVAGVCTGLAQRFGLPPWHVQLGCLLVGLGMFGTTAFCYGMAWLLLPDQEDRIAAEDAFRGRFSRAFVGAVCLILVGLPSPSFGPSLRLGTSGDSPRLPFVVLYALAVAGYLLVRLSASHSTPRLRTLQPGQMPTGVSLGKTGATPLPEAQQYGTSGDVERPAPAPRFVGWTIGLALLVGLVALAATSAFGDDGTAWQVAAASAAVVLGLAVVLTGLRGRRAGGPLVVFGIVLSLMAMSPGREWTGVIPTGPVGDRTETITSVADQRISRGVGDLLLDLTHVGGASRQSATLTLVGGVGDITVRYPSNLGITVERHGGVGDILGVPSDHHLGRAGAPTQLRIVVRGGVGDVTFKEAPQ